MGAPHRFVTRAATLLALLALAFPAGAWAAEASSPQVRSLARAALEDPAALERLRTIDRVDGRAVPIGEALRGGDRQALQARLRVLAEGSGAAGAPAGSGPRDTARDVLSERRYNESKLPQPLRGVFAWIADRLAPVWNWIADRFSSLASGFPGGPGILYALLAGALLAATALFAVRAGARRQSVVGGASAAGRLGAGQTPAALLNAAARAEARGELDEALRLRFRAGLLDLDRRELIELHPALTNHEILSAVPSPTLDGLVEGFEAVAYGGRPAGSEDLREARDGWPRVPEEAGSR